MTSIFQALQFISNSFSVIFWLLLHPKNNIIKYSQIKLYLIFIVNLSWFNIPPRQVFCTFPLRPSAAQQQCLRPAAKVQHDPKPISSVYTIPTALSAFGRHCAEVQTSVSFGWKRSQVVFVANIREDRAICWQQVGDTAAALRLGEVGKDGKPDEVEGH